MVCITTSNVPEERSLSPTAASTGSPMGALSSGPHKCERQTGRSGQITQASTDAFPETHMPFLPEMFEELARIDEQQRVISSSEADVNVRLQLAADRVLLLHLHLHRQLHQHALYVVLYAIPCARPTSVPNVPSCVTTINTRSEKMVTAKSVGTPLTSCDTIIICLSQHKAQQPEG